jgi:peptide/nickel transport system permease protein
MLRFITKRLIYGLFVMIGVVFIVFLMYHFAPVDPARSALGQRADEEALERIRKKFNLDQPFHTRFLLYLNDVSPISVHKEDPESLIFLDPEKYVQTKKVQSGMVYDYEESPTYKTLFNTGKLVWVVKKPYLGVSISYLPGEDVSKIIGEKIFPTFLLGTFAIILASFIGIILGVLAAVNRNSFLDNFAVSLSIMGISLPSYVSSILLLVLFNAILYEYTGWDLSGSLLTSDDYGNPYYDWNNLILPVIALGVRPVAIITQLTRSTMLDVMGQDYIRTAKAKGLGYYTVLVKHTLRNALNPVITSITGWFAALLAGAYFVEHIFNYNGLGGTTLSALMEFDYPIVMGSVLLTATVFVVVNIFVDILYGILDPRVKVTN